MQYIEERIRSAAEAIQLAKEASVDDTKSSAGDKYETTREMMQQEIDRNQKALFEANKLKHVLLQIAIDKISETIQNGSLITTSNGNFFIAVSANQITHENISYYPISSNSPLGRKMLGLKKGDSFNFNGKNFDIRNVF